MAFWCNSKLKSGVNPHCRKQTQIIHTHNHPHTSSMAANVPKNVIKPQSIVNIILWEILTILYSLQGVGILPLSAYYSLNTIICLKPYILIPILTAAKKNLPDSKIIDSYGMMTGCLITVLQHTDKTVWRHLISLNIWRNKTSSFITKLLTVIVGK